MASMPQRQPPNRQASPEHTSDEQASPTTSQTPILTRSMNSEDSQAVILGHRPTETTSAPAETGHRTPDEPDSQVKKCWICFSDANEDTPETSPWRDPCPCALVAHEECLLDWIADTEAPKNSRNRSFGAPQITCPQCKSEIKLARPKNYIVDVTRGLERLGGRLVWPTSLTLLSGLILQGNSAVGAHTIYRIFGREDAYRILRPRMQHLIAPHLDLGLGPRTLAATVLYNTAEALRHWRVTFGLQLITPLLILSRTTLADSVLPALPVLFLATQAHSENEVLDFTAWPPSASMAFAVLPYARSLYNFYYERVWAKKEQEWIREVQPRNGQDNGAEGEQQPEGGTAAAAQADEGDNMFEVRIDGGIWEDWEGERPAQEQEHELEREQVQAQRPNDTLPQEQNQDQEAPAAAAPPPDIADNRAAQPADAAAQPVAQQPQNNERRLSFSTTAVAETVLGALAFPTIAELSGELLRLALPTSWTSAKPAGDFLRPHASGLLQEKWGRSLVGGCLFVVVKDALMLYVRWRSAKMHRERRVLDYDRKKGKVLQV